MSALTNKVIRRDLAAMGRILRDAKHDRHMRQLQAEAEQRRAVRRKELVGMIREIDCELPALQHTLEGMAKAGRCRDPLLLSVEAKIGYRTNRRHELSAELNDSLRKRRIMYRH